MRAVQASFHLSHHPGRLVSNPAYLQKIDPSCVDENDKSTAQVLGSLT